MSINSCAPTVCIQPPTLLTNCADAILAKSRERNGAHAEEPAFPDAPSRGGSSVDSAIKPDGTARLVGYTALRPPSADPRTFAGLVELLCVLEITSRA